MPLHSRKLRVVIKKIFFIMSVSKADSKLSAKISKTSEDWLRDLYKKTNYAILLQSLFQSLWTQLWVWVSFREKTISKFLTEI